MSGNFRLTGKTQKIALRMLRKVCGILDKYNVPYVLEGGTLLGIVREDRLLPWDNDLDLTIAEKDMEKVLKLKWQFFWAGYRIKLRPSKHEMPHFPKGAIRLLKIQTNKYLLMGTTRLMDIFVKKKLKISITG